MKKLLLLFATVGISLFASCDKEPEEDPKPFPIGVWRTSHEYFNLTVADGAHPEFLKAKREKEASGAVTEADSYRLTFNEDGTGSGSGIRYDAAGRYDFNFTWRLTDGYLTVTMTESEYGCVLYSDRIVWEKLSPGAIISGESEIEKCMDGLKEVLWMVEKSSTDDMVLATSYRATTTFTDVYIELDETHSFRYTFEKVK
jgi:hypothetical protein